jgi:Tfp pilus assembly protein PilF
MRSILCALAFLLLSACASTPVARSSEASLFDDSLFAPQSETIDPVAVFAPSPQMLAFIQSDIIPLQHEKGRQPGLVDALFDGRVPWLDYDTTLTRTAAEAFETRSGNCLSLVLMTASFAKQLGLDVRYQSVYTLEAWSRDDDLEYLTRHVNLILLLPPYDDQMLVDFAPVPPNTQQRVRVLEEGTVVAMYMNNHAVELLAQHQFDRAYWWAKSAIEQDSNYLDAVNTLAVIYRAHGRPVEAERALRLVLASEPDNIVALDNLVRVLHEQGRDAESAAVARRVAELRPVPPFHNYDLGLAALKQGRYDVAKTLFQKEMRRDARYDKFHASLALAYFGLGEMAKARAQMAIAVDNSTTIADRAMYSRMLERLKSGQQPEAH